MLHYKSKLNLFQSLLPNSYVLNTILYTTFDKVKIHELCLQGTAMLNLETKGVYTREQCKKVNDRVLKSRQSNRRPGQGAFNVGHNHCGKFM